MGDDITLQMAGGENALKCESVGATKEWSSFLVKAGEGGVCECVAGGAPASLHWWSEGVFALRTHDEHITSPLKHTPTPTCEDWVIPNLSRPVKERIS